MNKYQGFAQRIFGGILSLVLMMAPLAAIAQDFPSFRLLGMSFIDKTSATANISFDSMDSQQSLFTGSAARVYAEYTNMKTGEVAMTAFATPLTGSKTYNFRMENLEPDTEYSVMGIMLYQGMIYQTQPKTFKTLALKSTQMPSSSVSSQSSSSSSGVSSLGSWFSSSKVNLGIKDKVFTGGATTKDGVTLAITNEQARVDARDTFTYTVRYYNERTTSLQNAEMVIKLPEYYEFIRSSADLEYDTKTNSVELVIGRIAPGASKAFTFTARALRGGNDQVETVATLYYEGGTITARDHDSFYGRRSLEDSVWAGFFPNTLLGWIIIILLITFIVIAARRYVTHPKHKKDEHHKG